MTQVEKENLFAELDGLLEHEIEARLRKCVYGPEKRPLVQPCLEQKALARSQAAQAEPTIARSAKDAEWAGGCGEGSEP